MLCKHSKKAPCSHFLSGRCDRNPRGSSSRQRSTSVNVVQSRNLGLLREACLTTSTVTTAIAPTPTPSGGGASSGAMTVGVSGRPPLRASTTTNKPKPPPQQQQQQKQETDCEMTDRNSSSSVVTFDLNTRQRQRATNNRTTAISQVPPLSRHSSVSRAPASILKRETSM